MADKTIKTTTIVDDGETITKTESVTTVEEKSGNPFDVIIEMFEAPVRGAEQALRNITS